MTTLREKALAHLREGRVTILLSESPQVPNPRPDKVMARVLSSRDNAPPHFVDFDPNMGWFCTCRVGRDCAHIAAVQLVSGHPSAAAKED